MGTGKKKIDIKKIEKESSRMVAFSKRRKGLFKKASELSSLSGAKVAIKVLSAAGKSYTLDDHGLLTVSEKSHQEPPITGDNDLEMWLRCLDPEKFFDINELLVCKQKLELAKEMLMRRQIKTG